MEQETTDEKSPICNDCLPHYKYCGTYHQYFFIAHDTEKDVYLIGDNRSHCGKSDFIFKFPTKPLKSPLNLIEEPEDENDSRWDLETAWLKPLTLGEIKFKFTPTLAYDLLLEFKAMGWEQKKHGYLYLFVVHHAALLIEKYELHQTGS